MPKQSTVNVAVIGAGAIGLDHIAAFQKHPAARVVVVAENNAERGREVGSSRVDLQACKLEYSIVSPK